MKLPALTGTDRDRWLWAGIGTAGTLIASGLLQAAHMRRIARDPEKALLDDAPHDRVRSVQSADGTALHVEIFGPEDGETVVLAHGWTEALGFWIYVIRALADRGFRVVAYDLRGHGDSAPAKNGDYAIPRFGEDLEAVLLACVPDGARYAAVRYAAFGPHASLAQVDYFERMLVTCPPDVRADVGMAMSEMDLHDALPRLTVPTIVIAGANDKLTPPSPARRIAEMLPTLGRLTVLENTGHMTPLEQPEAVVEALTELATLTAERVSA